MKNKIQRVHCCVRTDDVSAEGNCPCEDKSAKCSYSTHRHFSKCQVTCDPFDNRQMIAAQAEQLEFTSKLIEVANAVLDWIAEGCQQGWLVVATRYLVHRYYGILWQFRIKDSSDQQIQVQSITNLLQLAESQLVVGNYEFI